MRQMRALAASLMAVLVMGCTEINGLLDDATEDAVFAALATTWNGTKFEFTNVANSNQRYDVIANGGSLTLTITADGRYSGQVVMPGETQALSGTLQIDGTNLIMTEDADPTDPMTASFSVTATTLTLSFADTFDFDEDGIEEDASVELILERA